MYKLKTLNTREIIAESDTLFDLLDNCFYRYAFHNFTDQDQKLKDRDLKPIMISPKKVFVLDKDDLIVPLYQIEETFKKIIEENMNIFSRYKSYNPEKNFRKGPVPGIGKISRYGNFFRHIKTTSERRIAAIAEHDEELLEVGIRIRAKRNHKNIPNTWDDFYRKDTDHRNWKRHRKHQWK